MGWSGTPGNGSVVTDGAVDISPSGATDDTLKLKGSVIQGFRVRLLNNGTAITHRIGRSDGQPSSNLADFRTKIDGATSAAATVTASGTDSTTAFTAGGKIGSANPEVFWLDTGSQDVTQALGIWAVANSTLGAVVNVEFYNDSLNINGVTKTRLGFRLTHAMSGTNFSINTTNITSGKGLEVAFFGVIA